jgi:hypothetical protein
MRMSLRAIQLPDRFYLPRTDREGREVRDVMPWDGAVSYATDGERLGIQYTDGRVEWLGRGPASGSDDAATDSPEEGDGHDALPGGSEALAAFADDFDGVNLDALVSGMRSYMDLHPVLKTVWRHDVERLELLRHRVQREEAS